MKFISFASIFFLAFLFASCDLNKQERALEYNNTIADEQMKIMEKFIAFIELDSEDMNEMDAARLKIVEQCVKSISVIEKLPPFEGDAQFRDAALQLFRFYKRSSEQSYREMIDILRKGELMTEEDQERLIEINDEVTADEAKLDEQLSKAQEVFSKKYNFNLEKKSEIQDEIDAINE
jgi:hypothetical protein